LTTDCVDPNVVALERGANGKNDTYHLPMKAAAFPDQCVKDFKRCYSIEKDWKHYLSFFCEKEIAIPEDATHLSVDCTRDYQITMEEIATMKAGGDPSFNQYERIRKKNDLEKIDVLATRAAKIVFGVVAVGLICCVVCACLFYATVVRPYQQSQLLESRLRCRRAEGKSVKLPFSIGMFTTATRRPRSKVGFSVLPSTAA
jgi:hypothetical protein